MALPPSANVMHQNLVVNELSSKINSDIAQWSSEVDVLRQHLEMLWMGQFVGLFVY